MTTQVCLVRVVDPLGWAYVDAYAPVTGLTWTHNYSGGPTSASFSLAAVADATIPHLTQGARVTIHRGTSIVWAGRVASVDRNGWQVQCDGLAGLVAQENVTTAGTLDAVIDACIAKGLPLTRPASVSTTFWAAASGTPTVNGSATLDQALSQVLAATGKSWTVSVAGVIAASTLPTTPSVVVQAPVAPPLTLNAYATRVTVLYDATGTVTPNSQVTVTNTAAEAKFGRVLKVVDLSKVAPGASSTTATGFANALLARLAPAMTLGGDLTVSPGQVTTASGGAVDLPSLTPGVMARLALIPFLRDGLTVPTAAVDVVLGQTVYDADAGTVTLSPMNSAPDPVQGMFGGRAADVTPALT